MSSGYTSCKCRDCFEIAISDDVEHPDFCNECEKAGCEDGEECQAPGAYGGDDEDEECQDPGAHNVEGTELPTRAYKFWA